MTCKVIRLEGGGVAIACSRERGRKPPPCSVCKTPGAGTQLCDFPKANGASRTCDAPLCRSCAVHVGPNRDHCPTHQVEQPAPAPPPDPRSTSCSKCHQPYRAGNVDEAVHPERVCDACFGSDLERAELAEFIPLHRDVDG